MPTIDGLNRSLNEMPDDQRAANGEWVTDEEARLTTTLLNALLMRRIAAIVCESEKIQDNSHKFNWFYLSFYAMFCSIVQTKHLILCPKQAKSSIYGEHPELRSSLH